MLLALRVFICLQFNGLPLILGYTEVRLAREGDRVSLCCDINSTSDSSVQWLYTPGEAYEGVQHIYTDGRMVSRWRSRCLVTMNATSSTVVFPSVHPNDAGYYECSDDRYDGNFIRLRVKLTVSKVFVSVNTAFYSTTELSQTSIPTAWDQNETIIKGTPDNLRLVNWDTTSFSLANLNSFVMIGGIVLVTIFVAVMLTALLTVAVKKTCKRRNKQARSTNGEIDRLPEIQTTTMNTEQRNVPGSDSNARQDINSLHDYEEIPATGSTIHGFHAEYETSFDRNLQRNVNPSQDYEEIPATAIHAEQGSVHGAVYVNDRRDTYLQPINQFSLINYEEISRISLPIIFPGPLNDQEAGEEEEYWPMVRDGYVEISQRPNISTVVYDVLQPKKESQQKRRTRLRQFRFFSRKSDER